jgi:hypothetical protein
MRRRHPLKAKNHPRGRIIGATWLGIPAKFITARVVKVVVGDVTDAKYWARDYVGMERYAVEMRIKVPGHDYEMFYLDNHDWDTIHKLTVGRGDPTQEFKQLMVTALVPDEEHIAVNYGFTQA